VPQSIVSLCGLQKLQEGFQQGMVCSALGYHDEAVQHQCKGSKRKILVKIVKIISQCITKSQIILLSSKRSARIIAQQFSLRGRAPRVINIKYRNMR